MIVQALKFESGSASHVGKVRKVNEDNYLVAPDRGLWLIADGMGGHTNGKLASATIVETARTIGRAVSAPDLLARFTDRIHRANAELLLIARDRDDGVIGSTTAALLIFGIQFACVW